MPTVPVYDSPQVTPAGMPNVQIQGLNVRQLAQAEDQGHQQQQLGQDIQGAGVLGMKVQADQNMLANQVRVDAALNDVRAQAQKLTFDPNDGYLAKTGKDAIQPNDQGQGLTDVYGEKLQQAISSAAGQLANPAQQQVFAREAAKLQTQFSGQLQSHVLQQSTKFGLETQQGTVDLATDAAQKAWNNPDVIDQSADSIRAAVWKAGQIAGKPANLIQNDTEVALSKMHMGAFEAALQNNNPDYAQQYLQRYKGDMTAGDLLKATGQIDSEQNARLATGTVQAVLRSHQAAVQPTAADRMLQITRQSESGGKDTNADGTPVTSSAGAKYGMQVLDSTARNPGHNIAPAANDSAAEYNRVGQQLLGALVQKYAGDPAKAWAAYNWGEGNVDAAIKKDGSNWLQNAPAETQAYVQKNVAQLQGGGGAPPMPTLQQLHQEVVDKLGPNASPKVVQMATAEMTRQFTDAQKARTEQGEQAVTAAQQWLAQNNGDMGALPPDLRASIVANNPGKLTELQTYAEKIANPPKADNMAAYHLAVEHPDELAKMPDSVFNQFVQTNFSEATQKQVAKLRQDQVDGKADMSAGSLNAKALTAELGNRLTSLGINTKPTDEEGKQQIGTIQKFLTDGIFAQQQQLGRKMTAQEISQYVDQQFLKSYQFRNTFMGIAGSTQTMPYLSMKLSDMDPDKLDAVKAALARQGNTNPSNDQILRTFWKTRTNAQ